MTKKEKLDTAIEMSLSGKTYEEIAAHFGVSVRTVKNWRATDEWRDAKKDKEIEWNPELSKMAAKEAWQTLRNLLTSESEKIQLDAVKEILDRVEGRPQDASNNVNVNITPAPIYSHIEIDDIFEEAKKLKDQKLLKDENVKVIS